MFFEISIKMVSGPCLNVIYICKAVHEGYELFKEFSNQDVTFLLWEGEAMILFLENMLRKTLSFALRNSFLVTNEDN